MNLGLFLTISDVIWLQKTWDIEEYSINFSFIILEKSGQFILQHNIITFTLHLFI